MNRKWKPNVLLLLAVNLYVFKITIFYFTIQEKWRLKRKTITSFKNIVSFGLQPAAMQ